MKSTTILGCVFVLLVISSTKAQVPTGWEIRENNIQNNGIEWENKVSSAQNITLKKAFEIAQANTLITYFFYVKKPTLLDVAEGTRYKKIRLNSGDAVFFSGIPSMVASRFADCFLKKQKEAEPLPEPDLSSGLLHFDNIQFEKGTTKIINGTERVIDQVAAYMIKNPAVQIQISGHTDNVGNEALNAKLSQDRADEVKRLLVLKSISINRITPRGYGSSYPITNNATEEAKAKNRRIEFRVPKNMIINGGFENPQLKSGQWSPFSKVEGWNIVGSNSFEVQNKVAGNPIEGNQLVELDGDRSAQIYQEVKTEANAQYVLSFCFSARPQTVKKDNILEVYWNNRLLTRLEKKGSNTCEWETYQFIVEGRTGLSRLDFKDAGKSNSLGTYIDNITMFPILLLEKE